MEILEGTPGDDADRGKFLLRPTNFMFSGSKPACSGRAGNC